MQNSYDANGNLLLSSEITSTADASDAAAKQLNNLGVRSYRAERAALRKKIRYLELLINNGGETHDMKISMRSILEHFEPGRL